MISLASEAQQRRSQHSSHSATLAELKAKKEKEEQFPRSCPLAMAMKEEFDSKRAELLALSSDAENVAQGATAAAPAAETAPAAASTSARRWQPRP